MANHTTEIFKTDVNNKQTSEMILNLLKTSYPHLKINFDLDDCDNILRIQGYDFSLNNIVEIVCNTGHYCELME